MAEENSKEDQKSQKPQINMRQALKRITAAGVALGGVIIPAESALAVRYCTSQYGSAYSSSYSSQLVSYRSQYCSYRGSIYYYSGRCYYYYRSYYKYSSRYNSTYGSVYSSQCPPGISSILKLLLLDD